jgi:uncharacterized small protein (DUF1192 family)
MSIFDDAVTAAVSAQVTGNTGIARIAELEAQLAARDARIAELEAQLTPATTPVLFGFSQEGAPLFPSYDYEVVRVYKRAGAGPAPYADVDGHLEGDKRVYLSVKDFSQVEPAAVAYAGANVRLAYFHEPEDNMTGAEFASLQRRAYEAIARRLEFGPILMSWTFDPRSGRDPAAYVPSDVPFDFLGVDGYLRNYPYPTSGWPGVFDAPLAFARERELPLAITEVGALSQYGSVVVPEAVQAGAIGALHEYLAAHRADLADVIWWHGTTHKDIFRDYRIAGRLQAVEAWWQMSSDPAFA